MLFAVWSGKRHRPTRDLDLTGFGNNSVEELTKVFREIVRLPVDPDGLEFDSDGMAVADIREDQEYLGKRVIIPARLGTARIRVQADIGFGDVISPNPQEITFPTLLDSPALRIRAYPPEAVIAEKLQAMVTLGIRNSRMKDFYDILILSREFSFDGNALAMAIAETFKRRSTPLPLSPPAALTDEFGSDPDKVIQWNAFLKRNRLDSPAADFEAVVRELSRFLFPLFGVAQVGSGPTWMWKPGGPWR